MRTMRDMRDSWEVTDANRKLRAEADEQGATHDALIEEEFDLEPWARDAAGAVTGRRILHLACSNGEESLAWARLGADVTGVDFSSGAIEIARQNADRLGLRASFLVADMYDLPSNLLNFDMIYLGWGSLTWAPDLPLLFADLTYRLRPGGILLIHDGHPLWEAMEERDDGTLELIGDYMPRAEVPDSLRSFPFMSGTQLGFRTFIWPLSTIVTAVLKAGLALEECVELSGEEFGRSTTIGRLPSAIGLVARRTERATRR